ncbi:MAG: GrpB family protein [Prolixibacteraceae bacterium]|nr:GrpB family protein [Prolixibacteraceae bacterium]
MVIKEKINFDNLTAEQVGKLFPIRIVPYNPDWKIFFEQEKVVITTMLGENLALTVEHIGSTSVVGLAAKPTIDILVEVSNLSDEIKLDITKKLERIGYGNMYNADTGNKMTFGKGYDENYNCAITYHIHIREKSSTPQDEIYFRDYLRQNSDARNEYEKFKYALAEKYQFNREDYTQAKTEFIVKITEQQKKKENDGL